MRVAFVAGDVRARTDVAGMLSERVGLSVTQLESGGRAAGTSDEALWAELHPHLAAIRAGTLDDLAQRVARGVAVGDRVVGGPDAVAEAMARGAVGHLLLELDGARAVGIAPGDHPGLALPRAALDARELPADQVLLAAAALTDAEVSVVPASLPLPRELALAAGVVALLRWDERTPG
ncbi:hypothetical protein GCM10022263_19480 [Nocardioides daeguensis]|uniref:Uncharacterized protein n=1 Tax=Nocardioides daeguensis TaxID=908359 RepID=A0ABP6V8P3_9ACTN